LSNKTRLICAGMFACCFAVGALAIDRATEMHQETEAMSAVWIPRAGVAEELSLAAREYRLSESLRILAITPEMAEQADGDLVDNAAEFKRIATAYRKQLRKGESTAAIDAIERTWGEYMGANQDMLAMSRSGRTAEATDRFVNSSSKFYLLSSAVNDLTQAAAAEEVKASARADKVFRDNSIVLRIALGVVAVLMFLAALFFETKVWRVLVRLSGVMQDLASSRFDVEVVGAGRHDEIGAMARAVQVFKDNGLEVRRLEAEAETQVAAADAERRSHEALRTQAEGERAQVVSSVASGLAELAQGNLAYRLTAEVAPEYQKLKADFNATVAKLQETMKVIASQAAGIDAGSHDISSASDRLSRRTEHQAASLEETGAALQQVIAQVTRSAQSARQARGAVAAAKAQSERSESVVVDAVAAMSEIERSSRQVSEVLGVIDEIAFQTNLLALNAGVEAARAGDAGRGFAVVATEVRALAHRSSEAAKEIKTLIASSSGHVRTGVGLVDEAGKALELIAGQVREINTAIGEIAAAAEEQAEGLAQVGATMAQMDEVTQQNAAMAEETMAASHELAQEAAALAGQLAQFKVGDGPVRMAA
jgi:methyl-accepting chemotaxis protein